MDKRGQLVCEMPGRFSAQVFSIHSGLTLVLLDIFFFFFSFKVKIFYFLLSFMKFLSAHFFSLSASLNNLNL